VYYWTGLALRFESGAKMPLTGIEGLEGCSQWNFMPRSDLRWWLTGLAAEKQRSGLAFTAIRSRRCWVFQFRPATAGAKKLGPYMAWIDAILEGDRRVHKKQRHTAHELKA
jgi:hypothetical protein